MLSSHRQKIISIEQLWLKMCLTFRVQKNEVRVEMERDNELQVRHKPKQEGNESRKMSPGSEDSVFRTDAIVNSQRVGHDLATNTFTLSYIFFTIHFWQCKTHPCVLGWHWQPLAFTILLMLHSIWREDFVFWSWRLNLNSSVLLAFPLIELWFENSRSFMSDPSRPHDLWPSRLLCPFGLLSGFCHSCTTGSSWPRIQLRPPALKADSIPSEPPGFNYGLVDITYWFHSQAINTFFFTLVVQPNDL